MAAWFTAAPPFLPDVIKLTGPLFTRSRAQDRGPKLLDTQIAEPQNVEATKALAAEMQKTTDALEHDLRAARMRSVPALTGGLLAFALGTRP